MYQINYAHGTNGYGINFIEACREIQALPSCNWNADIGEMVNGCSEVRLNGNVIATVTVLRVAY